MSSVRGNTKDSAADGTDPYVKNPAGNYKRGPGGWSFVVERKGGATSTPGSGSGSGVADAALTSPAGAHHKIKGDKFTKVRARRAAEGAAAQAAYERAKRPDVLQPAQEASGGAAALGGSGHSAVIGGRRAGGRGVAKAAAMEAANTSGTVATATAAAVFGTDADTSALGSRKRSIGSVASPVAEVSRGISSYHVLHFLL